MIMIQDCLGKVLVSKITNICYFHGCEVGLPTVVCHDVVSLVIFRYLWFWYFHGYFYDIDGYICFMLDLYVANDSDYSFLKNHVG